jgi:hypothetical protein
MPDIQDLVAENRQRVKTTEGNFLETAERGRIELSFSRNSVAVDVTIEVYKRSLNDGLYSGHPNGSKHGSGQGVAGDVRDGTWTLVESSTNSVAWTRTGRTAIRDALNGDTGALAEGGIGTGTSDAASGDTALNAKSSQVHAFGVKDASDVTRGVSIYSFADHENAATEFGLFDADGRLLARATTDDVTPTNEEEVRVGVVLDIQGSGVGDAVVTNDGEAAVADALQQKSTVVGLLEFAYGSGSSAFSKSDSALTTEEFRKNLAREKELEALRVQRRVQEQDPANADLDLSELGVYDNQGRLVYATTFDAFTYDENTEFKSSVGFLFS